MQDRPLVPALLLGSLFALFTACGGSTTAVSTAASPQVVQPAAISHVVIVVEENKNYSQVIGSPDMPFLNSLAGRGAVLANYFGNGMDSLPNYFMMTVGDTVSADASFSGTVHSDNVVRRLLASSKTWKAYAESIPSAGYLGGDAPPYVKVHNPFAYLEDVQNSPEQANRMVPVDQFAADVSAGTLPNYSFIIPNNSSNSHDCPPNMATCSDVDTLRYSDTWLQAHLQPLLDSPLWQDTIVIVTYDEAEGDTTNGGGHVATVIAGAKVRGGVEVQTKLQHQSLLRLSLKALGLQDYPGMAASAPDMDGAFSGVLP